MYIVIIDVKVNEFHASFVMTHTWDLKIDIALMEYLLKEAEKGQKDNFSISARESSIY